MVTMKNKKHLKNVGPIRHCEPSHAHSPGVATVARRHCRTPPAHRCPRRRQRQHQRQRQRVTEGTAMDPIVWAQSNKKRRKTFMQEIVTIKFDCAMQLTKWKRRLFRLVGKHFRQRCNTQYSTTFIAMRLSVCLSVSVRSHNTTTTRPNFTNFCACYLRPWLLRQR